MSYDVKELVHIRTEMSCVEQREENIHVKKICQRGGCKPATTALQLLYSEQGSILWHRLPR